jgi:hypothetical protein
MGVAPVNRMFVMAMGTFRLLLGEIIQYHFRLRTLLEPCKGLFPLGWTQPFCLGEPMMNSVCLHRTTPNNGPTSRMVRTNS